MTPQVPGIQKWRFVQLASVCVILTLLTSQAPAPAPPWAENTAVPPSAGMDRLRGLVWQAAGIGASPDQPARRHQLSQELANAKAGQRSSPEEQTTGAVRLYTQQDRRTK